jgi:hypothetical protein
MTAFLGRVTSFVGLTLLLDLAFGFGIRIFNFGAVFWKLLLLRSRFKAPADPSFPLLVPRRIRNSKRAISDLNAAPLLRLRNRADEITIPVSATPANHQKS